MKKIFLSIFIVLFAVIFVRFAFAQTPDCTNPSSLSLDQINSCLDTLSNAKSQSEKATKPLEDQVNAIGARVNFIEGDLTVKKKDIDNGYKNLEKEQLILNQTIRDFYIKNYYNSPLLILLTAKSAQDLTQALGYQKATADRDKAIITSIVLSLTTLEERKKELENEEASIVIVKDKLSKVVAGAKAYQATLTNQISSLSAKQQQILSQRLAGLNIPLYAGTGGGCSSDLTNGKDPGFGNAFGFFTFGVPNRVGLNQYGAWGRAKAGQDYNQILQAYYNYDSIEKRDAQINVEGYQSYSIDDYVKRVYEVPASWTDNDSAALKAQAIAVRSYALAYTNNGSGSICTTQQCQVFKPDPKTDNNNAWINAVDATAGLVMVQGGNPIKAWFSSTHGGYVHSSGDIGWSGTSWTKSGQDASGNIGNFSDLKSNAYDKDSPWFYCDWGARSQYGGTAWLKNDEVADIANVLLLVQADGSTKEHLYQPDKANLAGTDTWDADRVKQELQNRNITPFNSVSSVGVSTDFGSGNTTQVTISGDKTQTFSATDFKTYFNLRAPSNIQIVGPLYNVEQR